MAIILLMQLKNGLRDEILSTISNIGNANSLYQEKNYYLRAQAIDDLEFKIIDRIDALNEDKNGENRMTDLKEFAQKIKDELEEVDVRMFQQLRIKTSKGKYRRGRLLELMDEYFGCRLIGSLQQEATGYDHLDAFLEPGC